MLANSSKPSDWIRHLLFSTLLKMLKSYQHPLSDCVLQEGDEDAPDFGALHQETASGLQSCASASSVK